MCSIHSNQRSGCGTWQVLSHYYLAEGLLVFLYFTPCILQAICDTLLSNNIINGYRIHRILFNVNCCALIWLAGFWEPLQMRCHSQISCLKPAPLPLPYCFSTCGSFSPCLKFCSVLGLGRKGTHFQCVLFSCRSLFIRALLFKSTLSS